MAFLALAVVVFALDQATKWIVVERLRLLEVRPVLPFFNLVYYRNTGSAFGLFSRLGNPFFIVLSIGAIAAVSVLLVRDRSNGPAYALILGGAAGNLCDRLLRGSVVDFLEVYAGRFYWPAFNVADSALTVGIMLLLVSAMLDMRRQG